MSLIPSLFRMLTLSKVDGYGPPAEWKREHEGVDFYGPPTEWRREYGGGGADWKREAVEA